jgi:hypothetical protein
MTYSFLRILLAKRKLAVLVLRGVIQMNYLTELKIKIQQGESMTTKELNDYWEYLNEQEKKNETNN